jgi:hypothetical protein
MGFGLLIYAFYGRKHSKVRRLAVLGEDNPSSGRGWDA